MVDRLPQIEKPRVELFDLQHVRSGLSFADQAVTFASDRNFERLRKQTLRLFGSGRNRDLFLVTNGGLDHPLTLNVRNATSQRWWTFSEKVVLVHYDDWQFVDQLQFNAAENDRLKKQHIQPAEELSGHSFEIWSMSWYPDRHHLGYHAYLKESSPLLNPEAESAQLMSDVYEVYQRIKGRHPLVGSLRPAVLAWDMPDGKLRMAVRPYRIHRDGQTLQQNGPSVHTAFTPVEAA